MQIAKLAKAGPGILSGFDCMLTCIELLEQCGCRDHNFLLLHSWQGCSDQKVGCVAVGVLPLKEASCSPQDSVSALLEQTAVELEAVEKKLEESRSTLTSGEGW